MARRAQVRHRIEHRGTTVDVTWKDIRNLRLRVLPPDGRLAVSAPHHVPLETVRQFLEANREWAAHHSRRVRMTAPVVEPLADGGRVRLWGRWRELRVSPSGRAVGRLGEDGVVHLAGPDDESLRRALDGVYRAELQEVVPRLLGAWEPRIGRTASRITLRRMTTRWGSCNTGTGAITLNLALAEHPIAALESVLVHEMVHLWERGHGPRFQRLMDEFLPDWRQRRAALSERPPSRFPGDAAG
jgi:predicted metal-dependent hydrolase